MNVELNVLFENAKGDPEPLKSETLGLKSNVSDARKPSFISGISLLNLSSSYDPTV